MGWRHREVNEVKNYSLTDKTTGETSNENSDITYYYNPVEILEYKKGFKEEFFEPKTLFTVIIPKDTPVEGMRREEYDAPHQHPIRVIISAKAAAPAGSRERLPNGESGFSSVEAQNYVEIFYSYDNVGVRTDTFIKQYFTNSRIVYIDSDGNGNPIPLGTRPPQTIEINITEQEMGFKEPTNTAGPWSVSLKKKYSNTYFSANYDYFYYYNGRISMNTAPITDEGVSLTPDPWNPGSALNPYGNNVTFFEKKGRSNADFEGKHIMNVMNRTFMESCEIKPSQIEGVPNRVTVNGVVLSANDPDTNQKIRNVINALKEAERYYRGTVIEIGYPLIDSDNP